jgi:hypothetical protein
MSAEQVVNPEEAQSFDKNQEIDLNVFSIVDLDLDNPDPSRSVA